MANQEGCRAQLRKIAKFLKGSGWKEEHGTLSGGQTFVKKGIRVTVDCSLAELGWKEFKF